MYVILIGNNIYVKGYKKATRKIKEAVKFYYKRNAEIAAKCCTDNPINWEIKEL